MTTNDSLLDRVFTWLLDRNGDLYGDEQERLRWYEASTAVLSIQTILVTWVVAVAVFVGGHGVAPAMIAVLVALYAPLLFLSAYAQQRHVRTLPERWSSKRILLMVLMLAPYFVAFIGILRSMDVSDSTMAGVGVGAGVGLVAGGVGIALRYRRERARELDDSDVE